MKNDKNEMSRIDSLLLSIGIDELPEVFKIKYDKIIKDSSEQARVHLSIIVAKLVDEFSGLQLIIKLLKSLKNKDKKVEYLFKTLTYIFSKPKDKDFIKNTKDEIIQYKRLEAARKATLEQKDWQEVLAKWQTVADRFAGTESKESLFDQIEKSAFEAIEKPKFQEILDAIGINKEKNRQLLDSALDVFASIENRSRRLSDLRMEWRRIEDFVGQKDKDDFNRLLSEYVGKILSLERLSDEPLKKAEDLVAAKKKWHKNPKRATIVQQWHALRREASEAETSDYERLIHDHTRGLESVSEVGESKTEIGAKLDAQNDPLEDVVRVVITPIRWRLEPLQAELVSAKATLTEGVELLKEKQKSVEESVNLLKKLPGSENHPYVMLQLERSINKAPNLILDSEEIIKKPDSNTANGLKGQVKEVILKTEKVRELINKMDENRQEIIKHCTRVQEETKPVPVPTPAPVTTQPALLQAGSQGASGENTAKPGKLTLMAEIRTQMLRDLQSFIGATDERAKKYGAQVVSWGTKNTRKKNAVTVVFDEAESVKKMLDSGSKMDIHEVIRSLEKLYNAFHNFKKITATSSFDFFGTGNPTANDRSYIKTAENIFQDWSSRLQHLLVSETAVSFGK